jgi:hypothetical protein
MEGKRRERHLGKAMTLAGVLACQGMLLQEQDSGHRKGKEESSEVNGVRRSESLR